MSCKFLSDLVYSLHSAGHVTRFQRFFGLEIVDCCVKNNGEQWKRSEQEECDKGVHRIRNRTDVKQYRIRNYFWFYLFSFGSKLGYELFYAFTYSYCYWNVDSFICRRLMLVWAIVMYVGQALKDIIKLPRPQGPNVLVLEPKYSAEYGMPSTHAMLSLLVPIEVYSLVHTRYEISTIAFVTISAAWCFLICCSRLYLGMHSVLDILVGLLLTAIVMTPLVALVDSFDTFLLKHWSSPLVLCAAITMLGFLYPTPNQHSPSRGDTCVIIAGAGGVYIGSWLNYHLGIIRQVTLSQPLPINLPTSDELPVLLLRTILGLTIVAIVRSLAKLIIVSILKFYLKLDPNDARHKSTVAVEVPLKIFTYLAVGFAISYFAPATFRSLSMARASMLVEA